MTNNLKDQFGTIDIYLFDQILKGRLDQANQILDLGCGHGRNLIYFLRNGYDVFGVDQDPSVIQVISDKAAEIQPQNSKERFIVSPIERLPFQDNSFDLVIANAVFHFARDSKHFESMMLSAWRVLRPGGIFFSRLASNIGISHLVQHLGNGRFLIPDGTERYLVDQSMILNFTRDLKGQLLDPVKTTIVQDQRSMTTWVMQKPSGFEED